MNKFDTWFVSKYGASPGRPDIFALDYDKRMSKLRSWQADYRAAKAGWDAANRERDLQEEHQKIVDKVKEEQDNLNAGFGG